LDRGGVTWFQSNQNVFIILGALVFKNRNFFGGGGGGGGGWWW